jgi:hypothetical protein
MLKIFLIVQIVELSLGLYPDDKKGEEKNPKHVAPQHINQII